MKVARISNMPVPIVCFLSNWVDSLHCRLLAEDTLDLGRPRADIPDLVAASRRVVQLNYTLDPVANRLSVTSAKKQRPALCPERAQ